MRITYNAPVSLTFSIFAILVLYADQKIYPGIIQTLFTVEGNTAFNFKSPESYFRLFTYVFGHRDWTHLANNLMFILLLGPALEERFGSASVFFMILFTGVLGGLINAMFFSTSLMGASGIVFMMIILSSFANIRQGEIPISFFFVMILYLWREIRGFLTEKDISQISHIVGGVCGSIFGFTESVMKGKK